MKSEALKYLEEHKEVTKKSHYVCHGRGIDDMMVREDYEVESVPMWVAKEAIEIALKRGKK